LYSWNESIKDLRRKVIAYGTNMEIDPLESQNFVKNYFKCVLTHETPSPAFSLRDLMDRLHWAGVSDILEEITTATENCSPATRKILLDCLYSECVATSITSVLQANIKKLVSLVWRTVVLLLMELDFFQIKLREKGDKQWSRIALADVHGGVTVLLRK